MVMESGVWREWTSRVLGLSGASWDGDDGRSRAVMELGTQDRRGEMQGLKIGPRWGSRMIVKAMGLTRDVLIRVGMLVAALNSRQEDVHEEKRSQMRREVVGFCRC